LPLIDGTFGQALRPMPLAITFALWGENGKRFWYTKFGAAFFGSAFARA
jgi:hypothetical protein